MEQYLEQRNAVFRALADPIRRGVVRRLGDGPASVSDLATIAPITLPSFMKHIRALEASGLVHTSKVGRVRTCELNREGFDLVEDWLAEQRDVWRERTDRLERLLTHPPER
jgi:DNA-binding transcriptional ArsR family regulator